MGTQEISEINLDLNSTLRYIYRALRKVEIVAIEFKHNGKAWRVDTPEEAIELRNRLEAHDQALLDAGLVDPTAEPYSDTVWTPDVTMEFLKNAGKLQKEFLKVLVENAGSFVDSAAIIKKLKLDSDMAFAGVLSGLSKQLKKLDITPWQLYILNVKWNGKTKLRGFRLGQDFEAAALELGWPEQWF